MDSVVTVPVTNKTITLLISWSTGVMLNVRQYVMKDQNKTNNNNKKTNTGREKNLYVIFVTSKMIISNKNKKHALAREFVSVLTE